MPDSNWIDKLIVDRDDWRMKAMDVTNHPVVKLLISERDELRARLEQVYDVLTVNWISHDGTDYRKALNDLITWNIQIHDDPTVSEVAKARADRLQQSEAALGVATKALAEIEDRSELAYPPVIGNYADVAEYYTDSANFYNAQIARAALSTEAITAEVERRKAVDSKLSRIEGLILESSHQGCEWSASDLRTELMKVIGDAK